MTTATCPTCAGPHLRDLVFQHRADCTLYLADTATTAADYQRQAGRRPATTTEQELINALAYEVPCPDARPGDPPCPESYGIEFRHDGIHERRVIILGRHGQFHRYAGPRPEPVP